MKYFRTMVCFANSRKTAGRCLAGKEWEDGKPGEWIRPVSTRPSHEISEEERRYQNGQSPQLLDIITVSFDSHQPVSHQYENHVIDSGYYWTKNGSLAWESVHEWLDNPVKLWGSGNCSYTGINNRLAVGQEDGASLYLIAVELLTLLVGRKAPEYPDSKRAVRGEFFYRGIKYRMDITDPEIERKYLGKPDGQYQIDHPVLCISLGDPYQGHFYKLIAGVLFKERFL